MLRKNFQSFFLISLVFVLSLISFSSVFPQGFTPVDTETITLTTYYPSPIGIYKELRSQRMAIGANYYDPLVGMSQDADLAVEGSVGIGTTSPNYRLTVTDGDLFIDNDEVATIRSSQHNLYFDAIGYAHRGYHFRPGGSTSGNTFAYLGIYKANTTPTYFESIRLHADGSSFFNSGNIGIGTSAPSALMELDSDGTGPVASTGSVLRVGDSKSTTGGWARGIGLTFAGTEYAHMGIKGHGSALHYFYINADAAASPYSTGDFVIDKNANVGIGTVSPRGALDVSSTTNAFIPPRMTTVQRDAISAPVEGMVLYNTTTDGLDIYTGSAWKVVTRADGGPYAICRIRFNVRNNGTESIYLNFNWNPPTVISSTWASMEEVLYTTGGFDNTRGVIASYSIRSIDVRVDNYVTAMPPISMVLHPIRARVTLSLGTMDSVANTGASKGAIELWLTVWQL